MTITHVQAKFVVFSTTLKLSQQTLCFVDILFERLRCLSTEVNFILQCLNFSVQSRFFLLMDYHFSLKSSLSLFKRNIVIS